eukprot:5580577-Pyramimonas_sp.AAC.1
MSFSKRGSTWANSALVVAVKSASLRQLAEGWEPLEVPRGQEALIGAPQPRLARLAPALGICSLLSPDWLPLWVYALFSRPIGSRFG